MKMGGCSRRSCRRLALCFALFAGACSQTPTAPAVTTTTTTTAPPPAQRVISGRVEDTAGKVLAGAKVEIVDGPQAGASVTTNTQGQYMFSGTFGDAVTLRITRDGYVPMTQTLNFGTLCNTCLSTINFELACTGAGTGTGAGTPQVVISSVSGLVEDTAGKALAGAKVEIVDGPQAGASVMTDTLGQFMFSAGPFGDAVTLRATKEGYVTATQTLHLETHCNPCASSFVTIFQLALASSENVSIAGNYTLTFTADSACTNLPSDVRSRVYAATVVPITVAGVPANTQYALKVPGTSNWCCGEGVVGLGVAGNQVGITDDTGDQILDYIAPFRYLEFSVSTDAPVPATSTMSFSGELEYCELNSSIGNLFCHNAPASQFIAHVVCLGNSRFTLTRR